MMKLFRKEGKTYQKLGQCTPWIIINLTAELMYELMASSKGH